jgi:hypothetical protein
MRYCGTTVVQLWYNSGTTVVQLWYNCGTIVVQLWYNCSKTLVQLWYNQTGHRSQYNMRFAYWIHKATNTHSQYKP